MYFNVVLHVGYDEFKESSNFFSIGSAVSFVKEHKDYPVLGYTIRFYDDGGFPLRCHWLGINIGDYPCNVSFYSRFRSFASFKRCLSQLIKIAKYYELPF